MKNRESLKILLMQVREETDIKAAELNCFARYAGLHSKQFESLDVFLNPQFDFNIIDEFDSLFIGGSSNASVLEPDKYPFTPHCIKFIQHCLDKNIPVFASCYGFQLCVLALGGEIIHVPENFEMGTPAIQLTDAAKDDLLFHDTPNGFHAVSVHKEKAVAPPPGTIKLAYTQDCIHSFKVKDKIFWAFQFHPEVDKETLTHRLGAYRRRYTRDDAHFEEVIAGIHKTPESHLLVQKFVDRVLLGNR